MSHRLPSNPNTISDTRPRANEWTPEMIERKYAGQEMSADLIDQIERDLAELAAWDNYERQTSSLREASKAALKRLLAG